MIPRPIPTVQPVARAIPRPQSINPDDRQWHVRTPTSARSSLPSDRQFCVLLAIDGYARNEAYCWAGNDALARDTGKTPHTIQKILAELEAGGVISRVVLTLETPDGNKVQERAGIILHRRIDPGMPVANDDASTRRAIAAVLDHWRGVPRNRGRGYIGIAVGGTAKSRSELSPSEPDTLNVNVNGSFHSGEADQTRPATAPESPVANPEPEPAPTAAQATPPPPAAPQAAPFTRDDLGRLEDHPELIEPGGRFIARELDDQRSTRFYQGKCRDVAEGREPPARLTHAFDAAKTSTWAERRGAAFTSEWNEWRPPAAPETDEDRFIKTNWTMIAEAVHAGTARHIHDGMPLDQLRERTARAAEAFADHLHYRPDQKAYLRAGYLRALDEFHAKGGEPIGVTERREAEAAAKAKDREWLKTKYAAPVSGRPGRRARQPVAAMA